MTKTITLTIDITTAQIALIALRNAEDRQMGECNFEKLVPDLATRQAFMKLYHEYNGDPEVYEEDMSNPAWSQFKFINPNDALGMLWTRLYKAVEASGLPVLAETFDPYSS